MESEPSSLKFSEPSSLRFPEPCSLDDISTVFQYYLQENINTDVSFAVKCGDGWIDFTAHKLIISMFSPVFADMCYDPADDNNAFRIEDVSPAIFEAMLQFMYGSLRERQFNDISFTLKMYKAAIAYDIEALKNNCRDVFKYSKPDKNNVFQLLDAAQLLGSEILLQKCHKVLQTQTAEVLSNQELYNVTPAMLLTILDMPSVSFSSEYELVVWVFAWAKNQCLKAGNERGLHEVLEEVLPYLNLTRLTAQEFGKLFQNHTDFISQSDGFSIFMNIANPDSWPLPAWCPVAPKQRKYRNQIPTESNGQPSVSELQQITITSASGSAEKSGNILHSKKVQPSASNSSSFDSSAPNKDCDAKDPSASISVVNKDSDAKHASTFISVVDTDPGTKDPLASISVINKDSDTKNPSTSNYDVSNKDSDSNGSLNNHVSSKDSDNEDSSDSDTSDDSDFENPIGEMLCSKKLVDYVLAKLVENPDEAEVIISFPEVLKSAVELLAKEGKVESVEQDIVSGTENGNTETEDGSEKSKST